MHSKWALTATAVLLMAVEPGESGAGGTFVGAGGAFVSLFADTAWLSANRLACPSASVPTPRVRNTLCALEMCSVPDEQVVFGTCNESCYNLLQQYW
jgi:hypothetical protein